MPPPNSQTSVEVTAEVSILDDGMEFKVKIPKKAEHMKFNRLVLRGNLNIGTIQPPGAGVFLAGPYNQSLPTIGVVGGSDPLSTDQDGYNTITTIIAGEASDTVTLPGDIIYEVNQAVQLPDGKTLQAADGTSVTIKRAAGYSGNMIEATSLTDATLHNITLDGNWDNNPLAEQEAAACAVYVSGGTGITISHCRFYDMPSFGIYSDASELITIEYNEFEECFSPIHIEGDGAIGTESGYVTGNTFTNTTTRRSYNSLVLSNTNYAQVFHNTFSGAGLSNPTAHGGAGSFGNSIVTVDSSFFHIENNTCSQSYWGSFYTTTNSISGTVKHNYFVKGSSSDSDALTAARLYGTGSDSTLFTLNICDGTISTGTGGGNYAIISYNVVNAYENGIEALDFANDVLIEGNTITRLSGSGDGVLLWNKTTTAVNCRVLSNTIVGFTNAAIGINNTGNTGLVFNILTEGNTFTSNTFTYSIPSGVTLHVSCVLQDYQAAPAPTPAPPPAAAAKVLMSYYPSYTSTNALTALPSRYTHVVIFRMIPGTSGYSNNNGKGTATAGYFRFEDDWNVTQAQVQAVRALGQKVLVSIGGAGTGYYFDTAAEVTNFVASFQTFYNSHGPFDGIDYNCYEAGIMPETASNAYVDAFSTRINQISTQLRALYGSDFIITTPPNPNSAADWRLVETMDDAGLINFACPQYYDWSGFAAVDFIKVRNRNWVDGVFDGDESKVVLGLPANYTGGGGPTLAQSLAEWDKCVSEYPDMRGVYGWNLHTTLANGDAFGSAFATRLGI